MGTQDPLAAIEAARARIAQQVASAEARREEVKTLSHEVRDLSETARSNGGEVSVTARPGGQVVSVDFSPAAEGLSSSALTRIVTETIARAQHRAAMRAVEHSANTLGEDSALVAQLRSEAESAFPAPQTGGEVRWND